MRMGMERELTITIDVRDTVVRSERIGTVGSIRSDVREESV
jgi:hypothetical protein